MSGYGFDVGTSGYDDEDRLRRVDRDAIILAKPGICHFVRRLE